MDRRRSAQALGHCPHLRRRLHPKFRLEQPLVQPRVLQRAGPVAAGLQRPHQPERDARVVRVVGRPHAPAFDRRPEVVCGLGRLGERV
jgi:hypothetical protein